MTINRIIQKIINKCVPYKIILKHQIAHAQKYPVITNPKEMYSSVFHIKDGTWELLHMPELYQMSKPYDVKVFHPRQDILLIPNAQVSSESDIIITDSGVVWDKFYTDMFSKGYPCDANYVHHTQDAVWCTKSKKIFKIDGYAISMLGVFSQLWSHFLVQFLPKLFYSEEAGLLKGNNLTILLPSYKDKQIAELVNGVLSKYPNVSIVNVDDKATTSYLCSNLYYIPTASAVTNHAYFESIYDSVIPSRVLDILQNKIKSTYVSKINECNIETHDKLYFIRRTNRIPKNIVEIENFFQEKGFYFVDLAKLSLVEKVKLLYHAKVIAGPASSAWSNVIFCHSAKAILLNSENRVSDSFSKFLMPLGNVETTVVTGWDYKNSIHTDYYIPVEKIQKVYEMMNIE